MMAEDDEPPVDAYDEDGRPKKNRRRPRPRVATETETPTVRRDREGRPIGTAATMIGVLSAAPEWAETLEYQERTERVMWSKAPPVPADVAGGETTYPREVGDVDLTRVATWLEREREQTIGPLACSAALDVIARQRTREPVREYLDALAWDGVERIDRWLYTYLGVPESDYSRGVGWRWLVSAVARTYRPGCQVDYMLVLEGTQGKGKSTALRALMRDAEWITDRLGDVSTKDAADVLRGPWLIEMAEMDTLSRSEIGAVKAFLSRPSDRYREAYGRRTVDHPRRCVFAGSVNPDGGGYLRDATGARRFWPVVCHAIDRDGIMHDRDQLWAEAVVRYRSGAEWWPDAALEACAREEQEARYQIDAWEGAISGALEARIAEAELGAVVEITVRELAIDTLKIELARLTKADQMRIAQCLHRLGWRTTGNALPRLVGGTRQRVRVYTPPRP